VGDTIPINYNNKRYFIDIVEAKPGDAISVIETDCNVREDSLTPAGASGQGACRLHCDSTLGAERRARCHS
jgi:hypothetical protein